MKEKQIKQQEKEAGGRTSGERWSGKEHNNVALAQLQVKAKQNLGVLDGDIGSSRLVTFHVWEELFIALCFPLGLLWDSDRKHMVFCVWQDEEDDRLGLRARQNYRSLILPMQNNSFPAKGLQKKGGQGTTHNPSSILNSLQ